jgi:hypothetical protein
VCEVIYRPAESVSQKPHWVVDKLDWVVTRYLCVQTEEMQLTPAQRQAQVAAQQAQKQAQQQQLAAQQAARQQQQHPTGDKEAAATASFFEEGELASCDKCAQRLKAPVCPCFPPPHPRRHPNPLPITDPTCAHMHMLTPVASVAELLVAPCSWRHGWGL